MTADYMNIDQHVKEELVRAIQRFVERQYIVAQVMKDLGLHLDDMERFGALAWGWSPERDLHSFQKEAVECHNRDAQTFFTSQGVRHSVIFSNVEHG